MTANLRTSGVADAAVSAPSAGDVLRFAAYIADLIGCERLGHVAWDPRAQKLYVDVAEATHGETAAHLMGLGSREDYPAAYGGDPFSCWTGRSGAVDVFVKAPLALGGLPCRASRAVAATDKAVA